MKTKAIIGILCLTIIGAYTATMVHNRIDQPNLVIYDDGQEIGVVDGREYAVSSIVNSIPTMIKYRTTLIGQQTGVTTVDDHISQPNADEEIYNQFIDYEIAAYKVTVNNGPNHDDLIFYSRSKRAVEQGLDELLKIYGQEEIQTYSSVVQNIPVIKDVDIVSEINYERGVYPSEYVYSRTEMENFLLYGDEHGAEIVEIQEGDSLGSLSVQYNSYIEELARLNNLPQNALLTPGEEIIVSGISTPMVVEVEEEITATEVILYETEYVKDSAIDKGESNIAQEGQNGWKEETVKVVKYNGEADYEQTEVLSTTIISEPVTAKIVEGTKVEEATVQPQQPTHNFIWPTYGGYISSYFGAYDISRPGGQAHTGIDIAGPYNRNIKASDAGQVIFAGYAGARGLTVRISHGGGIVTEYAHLDQINVSTGQYVQQGQHIGLMGSTGFVTGVHLHFEVIVNGVQRNPLDYL